MLTPAQRHFQRVMAERRGQAEDESDIQRTAHEQILHRLRLDQSRLKGVQSDATKAEMKAVMLPEYEGWIEGTLEGDSGRQDEVISTLMVWAIDCQQYSLALELGRYVIRHGLTLPDNFSRDAATFFTEEISNPVLNLAAADADADLSGFTATLDAVADITVESDMPDVVRAKLCKARAVSRRGVSDAETRADMLRLYREAIVRNPNAGVKKEIAALTRELKKLPANTGVDGAEPADAATDNAADSSKPTRAHAVKTTASKTVRRAAKKTARKTTKN